MLALSLITALVGLLHFGYVTHHSAIIRECALNPPSKCAPSFECCYPGILDSQCECERATSVTIQPQYMLLGHSMLDVCRHVRRPDSPNLLRVTCYILGIDVLSLPRFTVILISRFVISLREASQRGGGIGWASTPSQMSDINFHPSKLQMTALEDPQATATRDGTMITLKRTNQICTLSQPSETT